MIEKNYKIQIFLLKKNFVNLKKRNFTFSLSNLGREFILHVFSIFDEKAMGTYIRAINYQQTKLKIIFLCNNFKNFNILMKTIVEKQDFLL